MALRLRRRPAFRGDRRCAHRLCPALGADCAGAALPRSRGVVARRRARRHRCHVAPARGRAGYAAGSVRGLRHRCVHHGLGAPPPPAARNVCITPRHVLGDSGTAECDGLTGWSRRHDSADPAARARVVRGLLGLVGHPRFDHMVDWCSRTGASPRPAEATSSSRHRRRTDGDRRNSCRSAPSSLDSCVGCPHRMASRWPRRRPCARSPIRHDPRGHPRGQARARCLVAAGRRLGRSRARTRARIRSHERVGRHRHGGRGGLRSLLGDCWRARHPHRGRRHATASLVGTFHGRGG